MYRNIKSVKRENLKRARAFHAYNLPPKAAKSPYFCPVTVNDMFWKGKLPSKSSKESRTLKRVREQLARNERRVNKMIINSVTKSVHQAFSPQLEDDSFYDQPLLIVREDQDYYL